MDMLDYRLHYAVMATEDRMRSLRRERSMQAQLRRARPLAEHRLEGRSRWSVAGFVDLLVPSRDAR